MRIGGRWNYSGGKELRMEPTSTQMKRVLISIAGLLAATLLVIWLGQPHDIDTSDNSFAGQNGDSLTPNRTAADQPELTQEMPGADAAVSDANTGNVEIPDFPAETIRVKFENSEDLPDGIAFSLMLIQLTYIHADHPSIVLDIIAQEMGLTEDDAELFRDRLIEISDAFREESAATQYELLCSGSVPKVYGDDVYSVLQSTDVARDALAEDYYYALKSELTEHQSDKLTRWIDASKLNTTSIRFDYKKRYEHLGRSVDAKAAKMCLNMFAAQQ